MSVTKVFNYDDPALWAAEPGPLKVVAINTGSGLVHLKPEEGGVLVAIVQADLEHHGISVTSHESQRVYQSARQIKVLGTGFEDDIKASIRIVFVRPWFHSSSLNRKVLVVRVVPCSTASTQTFMPKTDSGEYGESSVHKRGHPAQRARVVLPRVCRAEL